MKETVNVNIGSVAFILDEDAYRVLGSYFDDIRRRLPEGDAETMGDIEARVAEIFRERVASPMRVITLDVVRATWPRWASPADFGEPRGAERSESAEGGTGTESAEQPPLRKLYRSRTERSIAGICGGSRRVLRLRPDADPAADAPADPFRRTFDLGLHHPLDRHSRGAGPKIQYQQQKPIKIMATNENRRLFRSQDSIIAGVCAGLAEFFGLDTSLVRIATLLLIFFGGLSLWVYIILWLIVPKAPKRLNA